jgi:hypothetical protein
MQDVIEYFMEDFPGYFMGVVWDTVCNIMGYVTSKMIWRSQFVAVLIGRAGNSYWCGKGVSLVCNAETSEIKLGPYPRKRSRMCGYVWIWG